MAAVIQFPRTRTATATGTATATAPATVHTVPTSVMGGPFAVPAAHRPNRGWLLGPVVVGVLVVVAVLGAVMLARSVSEQSGAPSVASGEYHVVGPGETLWSIAADLDPYGPRAPVVGRLVELNGGEGAVELGDVVALPILSD